MKHSDDKALKDTSPEFARDQVIDRLYDVALDPARYEELLDQWETLVSPLRPLADQDKGTVLSDAAIEAHFDRADQFLDRWEKGHRSVDERKALISQFDMVAAFLVGDDLTIGALNEAASAVLNVKAGAPVSQLPVDEDDLPTLTGQIQKMLTGKAQRSAVFRVRGGADGRFIVFHMRLSYLSTGAPVVVAATSELSWPEGFGEILHTAFDFTQAEVDVVRLLVECCSVKEIAELRGRSIDTVRAQIKSILSKTETRSQIELVRLTLSMMDIAGFTMDAAAEGPAMREGSHGLEPKEFQTLWPTDGRRLDYLILGDPNGVPCLFMHLDYGLCRWPASAEREAKKRGIKVIVPIRAGYAHTDDLPKKAEFARGMVSDMKTVLDAENVSRCPVLTLGSDTYFAAHLEHFYPGTVSAMICCAGTLPITKAAQYERMDKWHRFILAGARYTPHLLPFMVKAGFLLARRLGKRGFLQAVYGHCAADVEAFENEENYEALATGSEIALSENHSAHRAFSKQVIEQQTKDWSAVVRALEDKLPIHFLNGTADPEVPNETLQEFIADYPFIDFTVYEGQGQLLFFNHWRDALDRLEPYLKR